MSDNIVDGAVDMDKILTLVFGDDEDCTFDEVQDLNMLLEYGIDSKELIEKFRVRVNNQVEKLTKQNKPISALLLSAKDNLELNYNIKQENLNKLNKMES